MRILLVPICFVLAMPFCCGLAQANANAAIKAENAADPAIPAGSAQTQGGKKRKPKDDAVAAVQCIVDDGEPGPIDPPPQPHKKPPPQDLPLPDQPHEDENKQPGTKALTPASPSSSSSAPLPPTVVDRLAMATMCETRMSDRCETFCEDRGVTWDSNAGSHGGTCYEPTAPKARCGCMCATVG
jgi:hypothetical protein